MDPLIVGALAVIGVGVPIGYWLVTRSRRVLGEPRLQVGSGPYGLGDLVSCRLSSTVRSNVRVEQVTLALACREIFHWWESQQTTDADGRPTSHRGWHQHSEIVWTGERQFPVARELGSGEALEASAELELPFDGAPSFVVGNDEASNWKAEVEWVVTYRVSVARWPDVTGSQTIVVEPRRRAAEAGR